MLLEMLYCNCSDYCIFCAFSISNLIFLAVAILACTPMVPSVGKAFERMRTSVENGTAKAYTKTSVVVYDAVTAVIPVGLAFLSLLCLVGDSYNPFLYFQF